MKHNYSTTDSNRRKKADRLIAESYASIQSICLANNFRTVHLLDIYHRILIYRLWWESLDYSGEELFDRSKLIFILEKIRVEVSLRAAEAGKEIEENIGKTIRKIRSEKTTGISNLEAIIEG